MKKTTLLGKEYPYDKAAGMLKAIAHPARLCILAFLKGGEKNVSEIQAAMDAKQSITSQQLMAMAGKGILRRRKKANMVYYSIGKKDVFKVLACIKDCCGKE
jgi:ArsR family transcriptional regulator, virulence genes transcriptional regulator